MSDALENKAVEILDKSQAAIASFADKLTELTKQYGPDVADAALQMARIDAADQLISPLVGFVAMVVLSCFGVPRIWRWRTAAIAERRALNYSGDGDSGFVAFMVTTILVGATTAVGAQIVNVWAWVGIFEPKLWLAKRILGL